MTAEKSEVKDQGAKWRPNYALLYLYLIVTILHHFYYISCSSLNELTNL